MSRAAGGGAERWRRYTGVRRRRWGKWVSEIRVPGTRQRLWLGSYATPEAAAVAHDAAAYLLRGGAGGLNFPERAARYHARGHGLAPLSPGSVQRVASDAGMAADAQLVGAGERALALALAPAPGQVAAGVGIGISQGGEGAREQWPYATCSNDSGATYWCTPYADGSRSSSAGSEQLVYGDISVDDMEILM